MLNTKNLIDHGELAESLIKENKWQVKLIKVKPGEKLSLQKHQFRSEHWVVVNGVAKVEIDGEKVILNENQSSYIPLGIKTSII